jgi:hypothetical protein
MLELIILPLLVTVFSMGVLPMAINKSTMYKNDWIEKHLRKIWMTIFVFYTCFCFWYYIHKPEILEVVMKCRSPLGYLVIALIGASIFVGYWWFAGKISNSNGGKSALFTQNFPGISFQALIRLNDISDNNRKYLVDFGKINESRFSIYISSDNVFTFSFIDAKDEPHLIQMPIGTNGIPFGKLFYLTCELGIDGQNTLLRMLVDGKEIKFIQLPFKVDLGKIDVRGGVIGADLNGNNGASFDMGTMMIFSTTMIPSQVTALTGMVLDYYKSPGRNLKTFLNNKQVWRINKSGFRDPLQNNKCFLLIDPNMGVKFDKEGFPSKLYDVSGNNNDVTIENK